MTSPKGARAALASLSVAYVIEPRFPGGTSSAIAAELAEMSKMAKVTVYGIRSKMFNSLGVAPQLANALNDLGLSIQWDAPVISADVVILHNPSFLKFQTKIGSRILTRQLIIVTHENFQRPGGTDSFDVANCLDQIDQASLALQKTLAPISPINRATLDAWTDQNTLPPGWTVLDYDWFNICSFAHQDPTSAPRDRRGRHSRPGFEKFPSLSDMDLCFPDHAEANVILGADTFLGEGINRPHWSMHSFQALEVEQYFEMIDFMVYYISPTWRESFGRVLAEAIAAGKLVITDPETASVFGEGVIAAQPSEVDEIVAYMIANPAQFLSSVKAAQKGLNRFSASAFEDLATTAFRAEFGVAA